MQAADFAAQALVFLLFEAVLQVLVGLPGGVVALFQADLAVSVDGQHVVDAWIQQGTVVGDQQEALFAGEVGRQQLPGLQVQMVGGLVDEQKVVLAQEEGRQQQLGALALGKGLIGPFQRLGRDAELAGFRFQQRVDDIPVQGQVLVQGVDVGLALGRVVLGGGHRRLEGLVGTDQSLGNAAGAALGLGDLRRKEAEAHGRFDAARIGKLAGQDAQQGGLSPAVAGDEAQLPVGIQLKTGVGEHVVVTAFVVKAQVLHLDERHGAFAFPFVVGHGPWSGGAKQGARRKHGPLPTRAERNAHRRTLRE